MYYPTYPNYYDSPHHLSHYSTRSNSNNVATINHNLPDHLSEKARSHLVDKPVDNVAKGKHSKGENKDCTKSKENKVLPSERLSVIEINNSTSESHFTKIKPSKEQIAEMAAVEVECFAPSHYESQDAECTNISELQRSYSLSTPDETPFLASHQAISPITGNHGDLFINPAFAAHAMQGHGLVPHDPSTFMSFLSDGSLVVPMGEIYCPPTDYFLVDQNGDIPPGLVSPPQGSNFDGKSNIIAMLEV